MALYEGDDLVNIASYLSVMAREKPDIPAVICAGEKDSRGNFSYSSVTMDQLEKQSNRIAIGLENYGLKSSMRSVLMVTPGLDFFALTFALFKLGVIPVMIDPGIGIKNLGKCIEEAEPDAFIGIPKAHLARVLFRWGAKSVEKNITVGKRLLWGGTDLKSILLLAGEKEDFKIARTKANDTAAILFTSGSTGISKGVIYTHGIFDTQIKYLRSLYTIEPGELDIATFPLFALFGPALGMSAIIPRMDFTKPAHADPLNIIQPVLDFKATNMFASPGLINVLARYGEKHGVRLPTLKRIISAGAPANPENIERMSKMLNKGVQVFTPYGATEALPVSSIGSNEILGDTRKFTEQGKGACVGEFPVQGIDLKIISISDEPIEFIADVKEVPEGEIGEIIVKGDVVTASYYNRKAATVLAKIIDPENGSFYHRMGDLGYLDENGRLWFCGRKSHRVIIKGETLFTIPCEAVFNVHPHVYRTALVGVGQGKYKEPVLCVELEKEGETVSPEKVRLELLEIACKTEHVSEIRTILFHKSFPVDIRHNAKIFREKLAVWAERKLS